MPRIGVTTYDLLISCPSDVKEEIQIIKDVVDSFNNLFGQANNIQILTKHWSKNSYPESGGKPQELLNKQFVFDCDAAIAVFWTRFGTPTEEYESGTEEEIEELIKSGKQVFLYFCDTPINPTSIIIEQYERINEFKGKYRNKGIYGSYSDREQFRTDFLNHLTLYFLDIIKKPYQNINNLSTPKLILQGVINGKPSPELQVLKKDWLAFQHLESEKDIIISKYTDIENLAFQTFLETKQDEVISKSSELTKDNSLSATFNKQVAFSSYINSTAQSVEIDEETISIIKTFADENSKKLSNDFFYLANLKKYRSFAPALIGGSGWSLSGSKDEENKYLSIINLKEQIIEYKQLVNYFSKLSLMPYIEICISNIGTTFDEDIDVYLKIPKNCCCPINDLPFPGDEIIEQFDVNVISTIFKPEKSVLIGEYSDYPPHYISPPSSLPPSLFPKSRQYEIDEAKDDYSQFIEELFCYNEYEDEDYDILYFNLNYLKQNINMFIPTNIHFCKLPDVIKYEIKSKYSADIVKGTLKVNLAI